MKGLRPPKLAETAHVGEGETIKNVYLQSHLYAEVAQLVEHDLAKVGVASSSLVFRSLALEFIPGLSFSTL